MRNSRPKRSRVLPERALELQQPNSVYTISCSGREFFCKSHDEGYCGRGFFSMFLQALFGIAFAKKMGIPYYVDFGNVNYPYSEPNLFSGDKNFWNYYVDQNHIPQSEKLIDNKLMESYPLRIWHREIYQELNKVLEENIHWKSDLKREIGERVASVLSGKVLGVHFRKGDYIHLPHYPGDGRYFRHIDREIKQYDTLFLATDDQQVLEIFKERYGNKLAYHPSLRSTSEGVGIHEVCFERNGYDIGKQALIDCYTLAACTKAILSPSNLSYVALVVNPCLDYAIMESAHAKTHRWKTNLAYLLNKWGVRKW